MNIVAGLRTGADQPLVFQVGIGLQYGGVTDTELRTHLAHGGHSLARLVDATTNIFRQLLSDALIEQQISHGGTSWRLNRNSSSA